MCVVHENMYIILKIYGIVCDYYFVGGANTPLY